MTMLNLRIDGADADQVASGLTAAALVLFDAGVSPYEAAAARWKLEQGIEALSAAEDAAARAWEQADEAAVIACCGPGTPHDFWALELAPKTAGDVWVCPTAGGWVWEVLIADAGRRVHATRCTYPYRSEREAMDAGREALIALRPALPSGA